MRSLLIERRRGCWAILFAIVCVWPVKDVCAQADEKMIPKEQSESADADRGPQKPQPAPPAVKRKPIKLQEVVVQDVRKRDDDKTNYIAEESNTATRTDTPLIEVPQSVEVVTQKVVEDQRAIRLDTSLSGNVSGVLFSGSGSLNQTNDKAICRGFECEFWKNFLRNNSQEQTLTFRDIANIERIEVLKGPSVLYGRSQPSGVVNILTKQPMTTPYASLTTIFGSFGLYRPMLDVSGPLTKDKTVTYRINGAMRILRASGISFRANGISSLRSLPGLPATTRPSRSKVSISATNGRLIQACPRSGGGWRRCRAADFLVKRSITPRFRSTGPVSC